MPIAPTAEIVASARAWGTGVGAFNVILIEHAHAVIEGARDAGLPAILQISENAVRYHGGDIAGIARASLAAAAAAPVPVAVHLDHATDLRLVRAAVAEGIGSVMFDASALAHDANVAATTDAADWCRERGVWVEAELGEVGGKDGVHAPGARTDPEAAAAFVAATGVDALAVAVGSSHAMRTKTTVLDLDLIAALRAAVPVPLVLHGASGVPEPHMAEAVASGITKVNIATQLNIAFTGALRTALDADPDVVDPRRYLAPARAAVATEVARLVRTLDDVPGGPR
ncbi:fructose-bisphosphate aldolase class II [Murinocardiopsis flavida]|uniref:Fructose-bisphosphate aldolase class II n=1 Tax=Murinocardiopsis flavida TaxID=645275 RepID=A0A2P8DMM5_9ACTN|nr:class II fructose-bisphosphate aldolase [Murinocardiopsis flavida]PSK98454.1 fructose-bisphosphate aldolase class II [Murinocardiopsis flavida]